jgi:cob(I)alamin adenosyltransferase
VKIYTKTGDQGETGLLGGTRVGKDHPRVAAYGDVDETSAVLGVVRGQTADASLRKLLADVQRNLFAIGAQLADPTARVAAKRAKAAIGETSVKRLERAIDVREKKLPALAAFVLPGGSETGALLHLARTVCRRAERSVVALARQEAVDPRIIVYLNRLSDLLFVLARFENHRLDRPEEVW